MKSERGKRENTEEIPYLSYHSLSSSIPAPFAIFHRAISPFSRLYCPLFPIAFHQLVPRSRKKFINNNWIIKRVPAKPISLEPDSRASLSTNFLLCFLNAENESRP